jgi:hypothetical protein
MTKAIKQEENRFDVFIIVSEQPEEILIPQSALGGIASVGDQVNKISNGMNHLLDTITSTCNKVKDQMTEMKKSSISELTLEFGLSLTAEAGVVFTKARGEATVKVTAKFDFKKTN